MRKATSRNRRPLTRAQLLPIPAAELRRIQLKHHVALAALRNANDDVAQLATHLECDLPRVFCVFRRSRTGFPEEGEQPFRSKLNTSGGFRNGCSPTETRVHPAEMTVHFVGMTVRRPEIAVRLRRNTHQPAAQMDHEIPDGAGERRFVNATAAIRPDSKMPTHIRSDSCGAFLERVMNFR